MNTSISPANKNLVLGVIRGYEFDEIKPFLLSLRNSGYSGDVCLLTDGLSAKTQQALRQFAQQHRITLSPFRLVSLFTFPRMKHGRWELKTVYPHQVLAYYWLNRLNLKLVKTLTRALTALTGQPEYRVKSRLASGFFDIMAVRFPLYYLYLCTKGRDYDNILLTDVRDVLFQRDPFDFEMQPGLCCFLEDADKGLSSCHVNSAWMRQAYDEQTVTEIGDRRISCAGTVMGDRASILRYLEVMLDQLLELKSYFKGMDQGVHNYIIYQGLLENVRFYENHSGPVLTLSDTGTEKLRFDQNGFLLNADGSVVNVLHQYDRHTTAIKNRMTVYRQSEAVA